MDDNVNSSGSRDSIRIWIANTVLEIIQNLLPDLCERLSRMLKTDSTMTAPLLVFQNEEMKKNLKSLFSLLRDDFFSACESLSNYATNETVCREIEEDLRRQGVRKLLRYLKVCNERFNTLSESYENFCSSLTSTKKDLKELIEQYSTVKGSKESQAKYSKAAYAVGALGFTALVGAGVVFLSPLVVPAATLKVASAAGSAVGVTGVIAGSVLHQPQEKKDIKLLNDAINALLEYQKCLPTGMCQSRKEAQAAVNDLQSYAIVTIESRQTLDEDQQVKVFKTRVAVDKSTLLKTCLENKTEITYMLEEFQTHMTKLKAQITKEKAAIDAILQKLS